MREGSHIPPSSKNVHQPVTKWKGDTHNTKEEVKDLSRTKFKLGRGVHCMFAVSTVFG